MTKPLIILLFALFFIQVFTIEEEFSLSDSCSEKCSFSPLNILFDKHYNRHPYLTVNFGRPKTDYDVYHQRIKLGNPDEYDVEHKVGKGKFAKVFKATHIPTGDQVVLKLFEKTNEERILREIKILKELKDAPNFLPLRDVLREEGEDDIVRYALIFDYFEALHYKQFFPTLNKYQIKYLIYETLRTLDYAHSKGIMHRDIKPLNVLMRTTPLEVKVIDWGHSDYYLPDHELSVRVASLHFKGPELLLNRTIHDYSLDIWSAGCLLAEMVFQKFHFFQSTIHRNWPKDANNTLVKMQDFADHLDAIASVLGTTKLRQYADKFKDSMVLDILNKVGNYKKRPWSDFVNESNEHLVDPAVFDLLEKMLTYDHTKRITAKEAMNHPYFNEVRENLNKSR